MLYTTTRSNRDVFTAHRAMIENSGPDGGRFVPFSLPGFDETEISAFRNKSFSEAAAEILNLFFSCRLTSWDIDFCIGRNTIRLQKMNSRIFAAELWHNLDGNYNYILKNLSNKICGNHSCDISDWIRIAVQISVLFGVYGQLLRDNTLEDGCTFDVSVLLDDFTMPIAAWYAKKLGLPIGKIIFTCADNGATWDLVHRGTFSPAGTGTALREGLERIILDVFGMAEVNRFVDCYQKGLPYTVAEDKISELGEIFFATVAGENRANSTINSLYRTCGYIAAPRTALCYAGIQDYRAKTGESNITVLTAEEAPSLFAQDISKATGLQVEKIVNS